AGAGGRSPRPAAGRSAGDPRRASMSSWEGWRLVARRVAQEEIASPGVVLLIGEVGAVEIAHVGARSARLAAEGHPRLAQRLAPLAVVAGAAGGDDVLPLVPATPVLGDDVVDRQIPARHAAVLAGVGIAREDLATAELDPGT